jgi:hypothetical protein
MQHRRKSSRELSNGGTYNYGTSPVTVSIEETMEKMMPPILPELQHLNTPPPPPPIPASTTSRESSGTIDIAIDNEGLGRLLPRAMTAGPALNIESKPTIVRRMSLEHRRNRSVNESLSSRIRNLTRRSSRGSDAWGSPPDNRGSYDGMPVTDGGRI